MQNNVMYPPFQVFTEFIRKMALRQNDPSFNFDRSASARYSDVSASFRPTHRERQPQVTGVYSRKTHANFDYDKPRSAKESYCVLHGENSKHELRDCKTFLQKSISEKRDIVKRQGLCFKCMTYKHLASNCTMPVMCEKCNKTSHCTAFHIDPESSKNQGGEPAEQVSPKCTEICGSGVSGKACAKTVLVNVYLEQERHKAIQCYAIIDDQSNRTLGKSELCDVIYMCWKFCGGWEEYLWTCR